MDYAILSDKDRVSLVAYQANPLPAMQHLLRAPVPVPAAISNPIPAKKKEIKTVFMIISVTPEKVFDKRKSTRLKRSVFKRKPSNSPYLLFTSSENDTYRWGFGSVTVHVRHPQTYRMARVSAWCWREEAEELENICSVFTHMRKLRDEIISNNEPTSNSKVSLKE